jgi:hypothetical protein
LTFFAGKLAGWKPALPVFAKACNPSIVWLFNFHDSTCSPPNLGAEFPADFPGNFPRDHDRRITGTASGLVFAWLFAALGSSGDDSNVEFPPG